MVFVFEDVVEAVCSCRISKTGIVGLKSGDYKNLNI